MGDDQKAEDRENKAADELEAEAEFREEDDAAADRIQQGNLNQGFDTGTTDTVRTGVNWPPSYRVRPTLPSSAPKDKDSKDKS